MAEKATDLEDDEILEAPSQLDCCNSGCSTCVFDLYESRLSQLKDQKQISTRMRQVRHDLLSDVKFKPYVLLEKSQITTDIYTLKFQPCLNDRILEQDISGVLPYLPGQHFILKTSTDYFKQLNYEIDMNNKGTSHIIEDTSEVGCGVKSKDLRSGIQTFLTSAYTPITLSSEEKNCIFKIVIKLYENGKMSRYVKTLNVGQVTHFRGPYGDFRYVANKFKTLVAVCMGTGIAPIYAIIKSILQDESDETFIKLLYGCRKLNDIILREEIIAFSSFWNFTVTYFITCCMDNSQGRFGENFVSSRINETELLKELKFKNSTDECLVLICGTEDFNATMLNIFIKFGFIRNNIHIF